MRVIVSGRHLDLSDSLQEHVQRNLNPIRQRYPDAVAATLTFGRLRHRFQCEIDMQIAHLRLRSEATAVTAYRAFDQAMAPIARRLSEARSRRYERLTNSIRFPAPEPDEELPEGL
jgi:ribosomal subunit interface protein